MTPSLWRANKFFELTCQAQSIVKSDPDKALQLLNQAIQTQWPSWDVWHDHGLALFGLKRYEDAIPSYHRSIDLNEDESWIHSCEDLKFCYDNSKTQKDGWDYFYALSEKKPNWWIVWHERGFMAWKTGRLDEAILSYGRAIELHPDPSWIWSSKDLRDCIAENNAHEKGLEIFSGFLARFPHYWILWHDKAWLEWKSGQIDNAVKTYSKAIEVHRDGGWFWSWQDLGDLYLNEHKRLSKAAEAYAKAIERGTAEKHEDLWRAWHGQANTLRQLKKYDDAIGSYLKTIELHGKGFPWCWYALGDCYEKKSPPSLVQAFKCYHRSLKLDPKYERTQKALDSLMNGFTATLRRLLTAAFNDDDLTAVCYDHFRPVYEAFSSGMNRNEKIQALLEYCEKQNQFEKLLKVVEERNPAQYACF